MCVSPSDRPRDHMLNWQQYTLLKAWAEYLANETLPLDKSQ